MEYSESGNHSKKTNSNGHISISDTDSTVSPTDYWHSPLRSESPLRSDDPCFHSENEGPSNKNSKALGFPADKCFSPKLSPGKSSLSPVAKHKEWRLWPQSQKSISRKEDMVVGETSAGGKYESEKGANHDLTGKVDPSVVFGVNKLVQAEPAEVVKKVEPYGRGGGVLQERHVRGTDEELGESNTRFRGWKGPASMMAAALTFRVISAVICLISFSVMAADRTQGWSGDSFDRYVEYRFCLAVNILGFAYSGFQAFDLGFRLATEKPTSQRSRYCFDFSMDQILAYLLASASSAAATRVNDWILNWGRDEFTTMASASIAMSFLAFIALAFSSLISGYILCCCCCSV